MELGISPNEAKDYWASGPIKHSKALAPVDNSTRGFVTFAFLCG